MDRRKVCRYFQRGSCKKQKCPFVHLSQNRRNCQFYMQGFCRKGANCNFYHPPKQAEEVKNTRKKYAPNLQKKQQHKQQQQHQHQQYQHEQQHHEEEQNGHQHQNHGDDQERGHDQQQKTIFHHEKQQEQTDKKLNKIEQKDGIAKQSDQYKRRQINMLLGFGQETSSDQSQTNNQIHQQPQQRRKPLNFTKLYPKKFPDYTKTPQSKQKILENDKLYFQGKKFIEFISKIDNPIQKQYYQIIRKYQDSYTELDNQKQKVQQKKQQKNEQKQQQKDQQQKQIKQVNEKQRKIFTINIRPLLFDPQIMLHFDMIEDFIELKVDAREYPQKRAKFQILNTSIPDEYKNKLALHLNKLHQKLTIFQTLKTFINSFDKVYAQVKAKLEDQYYSQIQLQQKIAKKLSQQKQRRQLKKQKKQKKQKPSCVNPQKPANPDIDIHNFPINQKINVSNMNYQIKLDSLLIQNAQYVLVERILLYIQCQCQKLLIHILEADRKQLKIGVKIKCKKCNVVIPIALQREVMQLRSQVIGRLGIQNGRIVQVGGIGWKIGCTCDAQIIKSKICLPGYRLNANCVQCFRQIQVSYMGLGFTNPFLRQSQLIENGKQLPNKGACKHMKLSFRWLRYGCCGRLFACDQCHIAGFQYAHDKIQGLTMLCGFCGFEQNVGEKCVHCKRELVRGIDKNGHWEGGLGCRDKVLLSRKDAKKYAGLTKNTKQHPHKN